MNRIRDSKLFNTLFRYNDFSRDQYVRRFAASLPTGSSVLDAGAGPCRYKPMFSHCDYRSQDFAAYEGKEHQYGDIDYVGDITSIPVQDDSFDYIICTEVLEHVPAPDLAVRELARILKPGGKILITAPLMSAVHMAPYHYFGGFTPYWYERFIPLAGLQLVSCQPNGGFFRLYAQESLRFLHLVTPRGTIAKACFFPFKLVLSLWFRGVLPIACHFLDDARKEYSFNLGYFVICQKPLQSDLRGGRHGE